MLTIRAMFKCTLMGSAISPSVKHQLEFGLGQITPGMHGKAEFRPNVTVKFIFSNKSELVHRGRRTAEAAHFVAIIEAIRAAGACGKCNF